MTFGNTGRASGQGSVSVGYVHTFLGFLDSRGISSERIADQIGLADIRTRNATERMPAQHYVDLILAAKKEASSPALAVHFAAETEFAEASIAGLLANASKTMLEALRQLNIYGQLAIEFPFEGEESFEFIEGEATDRIVDTRVLPDGSIELIESAMTFLITGPKRFLPSSHVVSASVMYSEPEYSNIYEQVWQCPVTFNANENAIELHKWVASYPVALLPDYAFEVLQRHADALLDAQRSEPNSFARQVETLLSQTLHTGQVSITMVAQHFGLSRQTIYRLLSAEGTTYSEILDSTRKQLAMEFLASGHLSVEEIAGLVGFADTSPFTRAFRRWTGQSPGRYSREKQKRTAVLPHR